MGTLSELQIAALFVNHKHVLDRRADGFWRPLGRETGMAVAFTHEDVRFLAACKFTELMPVGAVITDEGRAELRRLHLIRDDDA